MDVVLALLLTLLLHQPLSGQSPGQVTPINLIGGNATLDLDFSQLDYELVLYPTVQGETDSSRTFAYTISGTSVLSKPAIARNQVQVPLSARTILEAELRNEEAILAGRIKKRGGWNGPAPKIVTPEQTTRSFTFSRQRNITSDRTVRSTLVASNSRAIAYLDDDLGGADVKISISDVQSILDQFTYSDYTPITDTFGEPSDVDGNGKVIFLFTPLVDQVGAGGFFHGKSLFSEFDGGNGNIADMMFVGLNIPMQYYRTILVHEFQHLISFNQHVLIRGGEDEERWLNEGLSHLAEDLVEDGHALKLARYYTLYLEAPENYALTGHAGGISLGVRGAAYLFVRGLFEAYGPGLAGRLVQTRRTGITNVETETGEEFQDLFRTSASRLFLSGTGLNNESALNYSQSCLTEPTSEKRILPMPGEVRFSITSSPISGRVKPLAPAFVRMMGPSGEESVTIQTETDGAFGGVLIPIPKAFNPARVLKADYFPQLTFDEPLQSQYVTGEGITISGTVSDPDVSMVMLSFAPVGSPENKTEFYFEVSNNRFERSIRFYPYQAGDFVLQIYIGQKGEALLCIGRFSPVQILFSRASILLRQVDMDFGILPLGQTVTDLITILNVGSELLILNRITSDNNQFFRPSGIITISPGDSSTVRLSFRPSLPGPVIGTLEIASNDPSRRTVRVTLTGTGLAAPELTLRNPSVLFGEIDVGQSSERVLVVVNTGSLALEIDAIQGSDPTFTISPPTTSPIFVIAPGDSVSIPIDFLPDKPGEHSEILTLKSNVSDVQVTLQGTGITPPVVGVPVDFFTGISMDSPLPFSYTSGEPVHISGRVTNMDISYMSLSFAPVDGSPGIFFGFDVIDGRFDRSIVFHPSQTGDYNIAVFLGEKGGSVPYIGEYSSVSVTEGLGELRLPTDYFSQVTLSTQLVTTLVIGRTTRIRGTVSDPFVTEILFHFDLNEDPDHKLQFFGEVVNGAFDVYVTIDTIGEYTVGLYMGKKGGSLPIVGRFSPLSVTEAPPPSPADFDNDGDVDLADFISFARVYGSSLGDARFHQKFDLDGNQTISFSDFVNFSREYGN